MKAKKSKSRIPDQFVNGLSSPLRILCFGAGAIGTYIGGSLALAGNDVVFLERPEMVDILRRDGLRLSLNGEDQSINRPNVIESIEDIPNIPPFDAAIFALKSYDTYSAVEQIKPLRAYIPPILCLQNGVENEGILKEVLGVDKVIPGTVTSSIRRRGLGNIQLERLRGVGIADGNQLSQKLVFAFNQAGLCAKLLDNSKDMKWSKMLTNLIGNASSAILDITPEQIIRHPGLYELEVRQLRETLEVMKKEKIHTINLPGTPVKLLAFAVNYLPMTISRFFMIKAVGSGRGGKMPSFHIDLYNGRGKSEVSYLNGVVDRIGMVLRIPTPVNHVYTSILEDLTAGKIPLPEYSNQPEKLIATVGLIS